MRVGRKFVVLRRKRGDDLMVLTDDESFAFDKVMINGDAAHIRRARSGGSCVQIVGGRDIAAGVRGYRKFSGAIAWVRREHIESFEAVSRYANDGGSGGIKFILLL